MRIEHIALWTTDLEKMRGFYQTYFNMKCGERYENNKKGFSSYFLSFDSGARIEIMTSNTILDRTDEEGFLRGYTHLAISLGSRDMVDQLTERLREDGFKICGEPRLTGDGYYESVVLDPEGNQVEITE